MEDVLRRIYANCIRNDRTGCLVWQGHTNTKGYGKIRLSGKMVATHRVVFGLPDAHVLHTCDNRRCCERNHLYAGDNAQNIADKVMRDRSGKNLDIAKVMEIKTMLEAGVPQVVIAEHSGVGQPTISKINTGRIWSHVEVQ